MEIIHAKSIGEYDYAADLQFVVDAIENKVSDRVKNYMGMADKETITAEDAADWVGINLKPFESAS